MIFLLIITTFFLKFSSDYTNKKLQINMPSGNVAYGLYSLITAIVSVISYVALTKFEPIINGTVFFTSFIYALICIISFPITFLSLKHNGIFLGSIFSLAGSNILPIITSYIIFKEKQSYATILSAFCILIASALPMISKNKKNRLSPAGLLCALMLFLISGSSVTIVKITSELTGAESILTLNLMTNVFMFLISIIWILCFAIKDKGFGKIKEFNHSHYFMTFIISFTTSINGYIGTLMYAILSVIPTTIISASVSTLVTVTASLIYKEKFKKRYILCIILSLISIIMPVLF